MNRKFDAAINKVKDISSESLYEGSDENIYLVKEYLRRAAIFITEQNIDSQQPFFDAAAILSIDFETSNQLKAVNKYLNRARNVYVHRIIECYLSLCLLIDSGDKKAARYQELYAPLIKLFQRGSSVAIYGNELIVDYSALPLNGWIDRHIEIKPYDYESLDPR